MKKILLFMIVFPIAITASSQVNTSIYDSIPWDTINFETTYDHLVINNSSQNLWQIGKPSKQFFDSAYSAVNAIITDTLINYPVNNYSSFDIKIGEFNYNYYYGYYVGMQIKHKFDTDTLRDGCYISVSYDYGDTWMNIINDDSWHYDVHPGEEYWSSLSLYSTEDTLFNGEYGFSGNSGDWKTTFFSWFYIPVKSQDDLADTTIIRFNFISDDIDNGKEGWMIDDIVLLSVDLGGNIAENSNQGFEVMPMPIESTSKIVLNKEQEMIRYQIINPAGVILTDRVMKNCRSFEINRSDLHNGIYFLRVMSENKIIGIRKIVVK